VNVSERRILRLFPNASRSFVEANRSVRDAESEQDQAPALDQATQRETESMGRVVVRFTCFRVRLLDDDNVKASVKDLLDGLRHAHLIRDDSPREIQLEVEQRKVACPDFQRTEIELIYP